MNRALTLLRIFVAVACLSPLVSLVAGDRYRVTLTLYPGDDSAAIAKRLAAAYQGQLETAVDEAGTFEITLSTATADLLARDPQVAQVQQPRVTAAVEIAPNAATNWKIGDYAYDDAGNIKTIGTAVYVYDSESRLKSEKAGTQTQQALTYDGFGNILSITEGSTSFTVGANDSSNRASVSSSATNHLYGTYDGAGNMTSSSARTYTYDALNVMTKSTTDASRAYVYNANDERIGTITLTANGTQDNSQWTIRDPGGQVLRRFWKQGSEWRWMQDYIYRDGKMLASESNDQFKTLHYHLDHLGTPRLITGNGGAEVARHTYYPFGEEAPGTTPEVAEPKRFTGHERDAGGLDYMHARFYDYSMGRFLSVDPNLDIEKNLVEPQRWNRYAYATNNPIKYFDPDGRDKKIYVLQSFAFDSTTYRWGNVKKLASNGYEVDPHRFSSESTYNEYLAKADNTDFVFTFSHAAYTGISDASFWSLDKNRVFDNSAIPGAALAAAVNRDTNRPAGIALIGCNTIRPAQDLANKTGVAVVGSRGLVSFANDKKAISILTAYASKNGRIDQAAVDQVNKAICPSGKCSYLYELALPQNTK
jgi:RHS repeat-associated protein